MCRNSGFGDWLIACLVDQVQRHDLDGAWFDDTPYSTPRVWPWPAGCLCPSWQAAYRLKAGEPIPASSDWRNDAFTRWVNWRYENLRAFQRRLTDAIRSIWPGAVVSFNS